MAIRLTKKTKRNTNVTPKTQYATLPRFQIEIIQMQQTCNAKNLVFRFFVFIRMCTTWSHVSGLFCRSRKIWSAAVLCFHNIKTKTSIENTETSNKNTEPQKKIKDIIYYA